jgi:hypothetical protein
MPTPFREIGDGRVAIIQVDGIAVSLLLRLRTKGKKKQGKDKCEAITHGLKVKNGELQE